MTAELERRRVATQATRDRFFGRRFDWHSGLHCIRLAHSHLRAMGWRAPELPTLPRVRSALAARRVLAERGVDSVAGLIDTVLPRIAPAMMLLGDIAVTPGEDGMDSAMICLGPRTMLGFHPETGEVVAYATDYADFTAAWRA